MTYGPGMMDIQNMEKGSNSAAGQMATLKPCLMKWRYSNPHLWDAGQRRPGR